MSFQTRDTAQFWQGDVKIWWNYLPINKTGTAEKLFKIQTWLSLSDEQASLAWQWWENLTSQLWDQVEMMVEMVVEMIVVLVVEMVVEMMMVLVVLV